MARKPRGPTGRLLRKNIRSPHDTGHTVADIVAALAKAQEPLENPKAIRSLPRESIVVAEEVFQWRLTNEDVGARDDHILELANIIAATGKPLDAILVFHAGDKFYVVAGHHRLAAYYTAGWTKVIPVTVGEGTLEQAADASLKRNSKSTRNLSRKEKQEAAWKLGKRMPRPTREVISEMTSVSPSTIDGMRRMLKKLRDAGEPDVDIARMTYAQALGKQWITDEARPEWDADTWMAEKVEKLVKKLEDTGIGFMLREDHEIAAMALERVDARLTHSLVSLWGFRPENEEILEEIIEEYDSQEPQKF
jgi:ParB-like chromosome segregation protein Spo0J